MTPVQNNITLNAFREAFDSSPRVLEQLRAFEAFCKVGLPANKSEEYRFTPVGKFLEANFDLALYGQPVESQVDTELSGDQIAINIVNGRLANPFKIEGLSVSTNSGSSIND